MIKFKNYSQEEPFILFRKRYEDALNANQKNIEAVSISSYNKDMNEVDSRYVNLKIIEQNNFIFFSNYNSKKAKQFELNRNIAALFFWNEINVQIRIKAKIYKLNKSLSDSYFKNRMKEKNALAISSMQSETISSFSIVKKNYLHTLENADLLKRPKYWGGYTFSPFEFEFWSGHAHRLNKRTHFKFTNKGWIKTLLQP